MYPSFILFGREIWLYQLMVICGVLSMGAYAYISCKKLKYNEVDSVIFLSLSFIGVFTGGVILFAIVNLKDSIVIIKNMPAVDSFAAFINILQIIFGGSIFYGGLLGGLLTALIVIRKKPRFRPLVDIAAAAIPLFHFWGRIGCFFSGCCYGVESSAGFTMRLSLAPGANNVNRFPVQLLESLFNLSLFVVLHIIRKKNMFKGKILYLYLLCYSTARFFIEFLRGDAYRGFLFTLSTSQIISIFLFIFSILAILLAPNFPKTGNSVSKKNS